MAHGEATPEPQARNNAELICNEALDRIDHLGLEFGHGIKRAVVMVLLDTATPNAAVGAGGFDANNHRELARQLREHADQLDPP